MMAVMLTKDVIRHFGSKTAAALAIGITKGAVSQWGDRVPLASALKIQAVTNKKLKCDVDSYLKQSA